MPLKVTASASAPSGYTFDIGYTDTSTGNIMYVSCVNNVAECSLFATCQPAVGTDQFTITFQGNLLSGSLARDDTTQGCTVNFDLTGSRE